MKLIDGWRQAWRLWSVRVSALGAILMGWATLAPDALMQVWNVLPDDVRAIVPAPIGDVVPFMLFLAALAARFIPQPKAAAKMQEAADGTAQ
ncbi:hypothetical protein [Sphingomonas sp. S2-65]|uniref:DUF7940 domain-containing protein n=1 Tax=Sphingomonas sp. S2-65 TaxID=2903960 RepID=UPI001F1C3DC2|nr:hypothetical protein [Sphingomonas sp. S2-65]UYY60094.1 hypothetical protein LZ586_08460 [Sphingomonas sp. S2-65]